MTSYFWLFQQEKLTKFSNFWLQRAFFNYFLHIIFLCVDHFIKLFKKVSFSVDAYFCRSIRPAPYSISPELFHFLENLVLRTTREAGRDGSGEGRVKGWKNGPNYSPSYCPCNLSATAQSFEISNYLPHWCKSMRYGYVFFIF